jgi:hypothetical protein
MSFDAGSVVNLAMPALQAAATIVILKYQKELYDDIAKKRIALMDKAVSNFVASIDAQIASGAFTKAFGVKPGAVLFQPIDTTALGIASAEDSLHGIPSAQRYMQAANRIMEQESIVRATVLDGRYLCVEDVISCTISDLVNGYLPVGDVIEIIKDGAERAAMQGKIGNTHGSTAVDLGITRLRLKTSGAKMHFEHLQSLNANVHRVGDRVAISDFVQKPEQRLGLALAQAQLIQQSLQFEANIAAAGNPADFAILQAKMQEATMRLGTEAQRGNMINQFVPNYAALLAPAINTITEGLMGDMLGTGATANYKTTDAGTQQSITANARRVTSAKEPIPLE